MQYLLFVIYTCNTYFCNVLGRVIYLRVSGQCSQTIPVLNTGELTDTTSEGPLCQSLIPCPSPLVQNLVMLAIQIILRVVLYQVGLDTRE